MCCAVGALQGVRGFNDRAAPRLPNGNSVFLQPAPGGHSTFPYRVEPDQVGAGCMLDAAMNYRVDVNIWNQGRMDAWNTARQPGLGMAYFTRRGVPYHYALADAFTVCDQYFQSTFTNTLPNRLMLFTGSNGLSVPRSGICALDNSEVRGGFTWDTLADTLSAANVSWRLIQQEDNFGNNGLEWFQAFQDATPGSERYERGMRTVADVAAEFERLLATDSLPSVLWIVGPQKLSEHPAAHPQDGGAFISRFIAALSKPEHAAVYAKTAFILNYDENGGWFDHHWPPTPPLNASDGISTVDASADVPSEAFCAEGLGGPLGLGFRVPCIIVSPWTRGNLVFSQVSDHTSVVRLVEERFGVRCANISPWRRAVASDLTAAFNWTAPDYSWPDSLRSPVNNSVQTELQCKCLPPARVNMTLQPPEQEPGVRHARPLPYEFHVYDEVSAATAASPTPQFTLYIHNTGGAGAAFLLHNLQEPLTAPLKYTVEAGKKIAHTLPLRGPHSRNMSYAYSLHGPNGFVRTFAGSTPAALITSALRFAPHNRSVVLAVNASWPAGLPGRCFLAVTDDVYGAPLPPHMTLSADAQRLNLPVDVSGAGLWYDITLSLVTHEDCPLHNALYQRRFQGHMEGNETTTSDPAMATGVGPPNHPPHIVAPCHPHKRLSTSWIVGIVFIAVGVVTSVACVFGCRGLYRFAEHLSQHDKRA